MKSRMHDAALVLAALLSVGTTLPIAHGQAELKPAWRCLPGQTVVAVRVPNGQAAVEALSARTQLGSLLDAKRIDMLKKLMSQADPVRWQQTTSQLKTLGFSVEDLPQLLAGESGFALVSAKRDDRYRTDPVSVGLFWINPGPQQARKLMTSADNMLGAITVALFGIKRADLEVAGHKVIRLSIPVKGRPGMPEIPPLIYQLPEGQRNALIAQLEQQYPLKQVDQTHWFVTRIGGRILVGATYPQNERFAKRARNGGKEPDFEKITGAAEATKVFSDFINAHQGEDGPFVDNVLAKSGVRQAMPGGQTLLEILADPAAWFKSLEAQDPDMAVFYRAGGVNQFTALSGRMSLDGSNLRFNLFGHTPAARSGVLSLLEQSDLAADVPNWLPKDVVAYQQYSLDLGAVYGIAKQVILTQGLSQAAPLFAFAENLALTLGSDLPTFLKALGPRHNHLLFLPKVDVQTSEQSEQDLAQQAQDMLNVRQAVVWKLKDAKTVETVFKTFAEQNGALRKIELHGFEGFRAQETELADIFIGKGYLVIAMGDGVIESVLGSLADPQADKSSNDQTGYLKTRQLLSSRQGVGFAYADMNRGFNLITSMLADPLISQLRVSVGQNGSSVGELLEKLLPSGDELNGVFGPSVGQLSVNRDGVILETVIPLRPR